MPSHNSVQLERYNLESARPLLPHSGRSKGASAIHVGRGKTSSEYRRDNELLLYNTAQEWVRHYQNIIMQLNTWVTTFNAAILTFVLTSYFQSPHHPASLLYPLLLPVGLSIVVIIASCKLDGWMRRNLCRIMQISELLGLFDLKARDGTPLLPEHYRRSAYVKWPQIVVWDVVSTITILVCALLFAYLVCNRFTLVE
jgi:hypothetical protein